MLNILVRVTTIALFLVAMFGIVWYFAGQSYESALFAAKSTAIFTIVILAIATVVVFATPTFPLAIAFISAIALTALVFIATTAVDAIVAFAIIAVIVVIFAALTAILAKEDGATEPSWALFIAALPLGFGTILGGALYILFFRGKTAVCGA